MTHLEKQIESAKSSQHAYKIAKMMALENAAKGDKGASKRAEKFAKKESNYAKKVDKLQKKERAERSRLSA